MFEKSVISQNKTIRRIGESLGRDKRFKKLLRKRSDMKAEISSSNWFIIRLNREPVFSTLKVLNIRQDGINGKIIHALIKASMGGNLDAGSIHIIPEDIPGCVGHKAKEDTFLRIGNRLSRTFPGRTNMHTANKSLEVAEVFLMTCGFLNWRSRFTGFWECI